MVSSVVGAAQWFSPTIAYGESWTPSSGSGRIADW